MTRAFLIAALLAVAGIGASAAPAVDAGASAPAAPPPTSTPTSTSTRASGTNLVPEPPRSMLDRIGDALTGSIPTALGSTLAHSLAAAKSTVIAPPNGDGTPYSLHDPHYGDTLFQFFQDRYFTAVTTLMVSQHFGRVPYHADEAEVLRGGMLLSYGMPRQAGAIFAGLIERGAAPPVRDRAWYYLAKIRYQRGYLDLAEEALAKVEGRLPADLQEDRVLLQAQLLMARGDHAGAAATLAAIPAKSLGARYARFNLGVALVKSGETAKGEAVLDALGKERAPDEEYRSLRDQANVALGYAALADHRPPVARAVLERVRLDSLHANKALLGFGWAAAELKDPKLALVPWLELAGREPTDAAALEARIAVPYAYTELGAYGQAYERYQEAIGAFEREHAHLNESIAAIRSGVMLDALIVHNPGDEMGWFWKMQDVPEMPHASHLTAVLAQHAFQEAFKNYRDLLFLGRNLAEWREKLVVFDDMLANREKAFADRLPAVRARASAIGLEGLAKRRDAIAADIERGERETDGVVFADEKQVELLARVERVRQGLAAATGPDPDGEIERARERLRLASGALVWQLAEQQTDRAWQSRKDLKAIDAGVELAVRREAELAQAQRDEPARFAAFGRRIAALRPQLDTMIPMVASLTRQQQEAVQGIAVAELQRQQERLAVYATQARFAVAQLVDRAYVRQESGHAAARP